MIDEEKLIEKLKKNSIFEKITNVEGKNIYAIIEELPKTKNTVAFKRFNLLADSTLECCNKGVLIDYIHTLYHNWESSDHDYYYIRDLAISLQNNITDLTSLLIECQRNLPLKFEELKPRMSMWDKKINANVIIVKILEDKRIEYIWIDDYGCTVREREHYEENRFYIRQVEE